MGCFDLVLLFSVAFTDLNFFWMCSLGVCLKGWPFPWDEIFTMNKLTVFPGEYCLKHIPIPTICSAKSKALWAESKY